MPESLLPALRVGRPNLSLPVHAFRVSDQGGGRPLDIGATQVRAWLDRANAA